MHFLGMKGGDTCFMALDDFVKLPAKMHLDLRHGIIRILGVEYPPHGDFPPGLILRAIDVDFKEPADFNFGCGHVCFLVLGTS